MIYSSAVNLIQNQCQDLQNYIISDQLYSFKENFCKSNNFNPIILSAAINFSETEGYSGTLEFDQSRRVLKFTNLSIEQVGSDGNLYLIGIVSKDKIEFYDKNFQFTNGIIPISGMLLNLKIFSNFFSDTNSIGELDRCDSLDYNYNYFLAFDYFIIFKY